MRWIKPLDKAILGQYADAKLWSPLKNINAWAALDLQWVSTLQIGLTVNLLSLGLPDRYETHAKPEGMLARVGLDASGIEAAIEKRLS